MLCVHPVQFFLRDLPHLRAFLCFQSLLFQKRISRWQVCCVPGIITALAVHENTVIGVFSLDQNAVDQVSLPIHLIPVLPDEVIVIQHVFQEPLIPIIRQDDHGVEGAVLEPQLRFLPLKKCFYVQLHSLH